jgi:hypothetical protein
MQLTTTAENLVEFRLPVSIEHFVCLINDHVFDSTKGQDLRSFHQVNESARGCNQNIASSVEILNLVT